MPDINRIRIANINYNDGNNRYDDFIVKLGGANTLIDMINGLGKTFFLQCMAQPMYPNAQFKQDFPLSLLFDQSNNNTTIHSLVEWRLDEGSSYRYALVGFCAYKKEKVDKGAYETLEEQETSGFGSLKYVCYYNTPNAHDIEGLPIVTQKDEAHQKVMSYKELEKYLKNLQATPLRDYAVSISHYKKDHLKELAKLNINSVEWKHLLGLNASEANAAEYLRKYRTAPDFIQEFLIPTIEESYKLRNGGDYQTQESRANTLMNLRQTLGELQKKESLQEEYSYIEKACEAISENLKSLGSQLAQKEELIQHLSYTESQIKDEKQTHLREKAQLLTQNQTMKNERQATQTAYEILLKDEAAYEIKGSYEEFEALKLAYEKAQSSCNLQEQVVGDKQTEKRYYEAEKLYADYKSFENKRVIKEEEKTARSKSHSELMSDYTYWGNIYGNLLQRELQKVTETYETNSHKVKSLTTEKEGLLWQLSSTQNEKTQLEKQIHLEELALNELEQEMAGLQKAFKHLTKEQLIEAREEATKRQLENKERLKYSNQKLQELALKEAHLCIEEQGLQKDLAYQVERINSLKGSLEDYYKALTNYNDLQKHYNQEALSEYLSELIKKKHNELLGLENQTEKTEALLNALEDNEGFKISSLMQKQFEKVKVKYASACWGMDYLKVQPEDKRHKLLAQTALLPYGILLKAKDFKAILEDSILQAEFKDCILPIINEEALEKAQVMSPEGIYFTIKPAAYFLDPKNRKDDIFHLRRKLTTLASDTLSIKYEIEKLEKDSSWLGHFLGRYQLEVISAQETNLKELTLAEQTWQKRLEQIEIQKQALIQEHTLLQKEVGEREAQKLSLDETATALDLEWEVLLQWEGYENKLKAHKLTLKQLKESLTHIITTFEAYEKAQKDSSIQLEEALRNEKDSYKLKIELEEKAKLFNFEPDYKEAYLENEFSLEQAKDKYEFYEKRLGQEAGDLKLMEETIKEYALQMKQKQDEILAKGHTLKDFKGKALLNGEYGVHLQDLEQVLKQEIEHLEKVKQSEGLARDQVMRHEGGLKNMEAQFEKDYQTNCQTYLDSKLEKPEEALPKLKLEQKQVLLKMEQMTGRLNELEQQLTQKEKEIGQAFERENRFNQLIYTYQLVLPTTFEMPKVAYDLKQLETQTKQVFEKLMRLENQYKQSLEEIMHELNQPELIYFKGDLDVLLNEAPETEKECKRYVTLIEGETGYLENIRAEKERIKLTILALKKDEESFINQCIQKCEQVYNELMNLEHLSQIEIYGHKQAMIRIIMTPLEETLRFAKMKNYINRLVEQVELIEESKKQAFLATHLTLKELFEQYVVNIKKCDVKIYKVEDLIENSRELSWNRAIGSTGQSNGMYMSLFICLISYIRQLYNPHVGEDSRKFIMLDSPFSGTAAAYIWEPVIKLLDRNNVQLLCVGYDIPSHLMALFDVKYNLAADYDCHKKQTIVVENIRSNIDLEALSYEKLLGEQIELF